jgi:hypothetical protein
VAKSWGGLRWQRPVWVRQDEIHLDWLGRMSPKLYFIQQANPLLQM